MESSSSTCMEVVTITPHSLPLVPSNAHALAHEPVQMGSSASRRSGNMHNNKSRLVGDFHRPLDKLRRRQAKKEILRRALTPPARRPTLRWLDFRPTPSRLRFMSVD